MQSCVEQSLLIVPLCILLLAWLLYRNLTSSYSYWRDQSIAHIQPTFPFGTDKGLVFSEVPLGQYYQTVYNKFTNEKLVGLYQLNEPYLLIRDTEIVKHMLTKDFHHFVNRGLVEPDVLTPVGRHLFVMEGEPWKLMRSKVSPAFTLAKIKMMFHLMEDCSTELISALRPVAKLNGKVRIKDFISRFTTDVIASCAFGIDTNSIRDPDCEFRKNGKKVFEVDSLIDLVRQRMALYFPALFLALGVQVSPNNLDNFFKTIVTETVAHREKHGVMRNDFIDLLIKLKTTNQEDKTGITIDEMAAQVSLFFAAGFETTASAITFCLYEISLNTHIQTKLIKEVDEVLTKHCGRLDYQALQDMVYMEAVINETLRRYSSLSVLNRKCTEDYKVPGTNITVKKGTKVIIPVYAIHHDPELYPEPYEFDPERFLNKNVPTRNNFTFMPFGEGPRICLGTRFAMMQMKTCLATILREFQLTLAEETPVPVVISKKHFITTAESPIVLTISNRDINR